MRRAATTLLGLGVGCLLLLQASHLAWSEHYDGLGPICRVSTTKPVVAMSFDDGPNSGYTPRVLAMLRASGSHATFFLVGAQAAAHADLVGPRSPRAWRSAITRIPTRTCHRCPLRAHHNKR